MAPLSPITFTGYVLSIIDEKRICMRVDKVHIERITNLMSYFYEKTTVNDTVVVNVSNARFNISIDWESLHDLKGVHVSITASPRRYSYWKTQEMYDADNNRQINTVKYKGVSIQASRVSNIRE